MYQTSREEHCRKLDAVWKNVESALQVLSRAKGGQFTGAKTQLRAGYECYNHATARYSAFLEKAKTSEARHELRLRQAIDEDREAIVSEKLREATPQERDKAHETASQFSLLAHSRASSRSRSSGSSTISLAAVQARAQAEAVKARAQLERKEAATRLEKARIEAELEVLKLEEEAAAADAQASALEAAVEQDGRECVHPHPPLDRTLRVSSYITEQAAIRDAELASLRAPVVHPQSQSLEHAEVANNLTDLRDYHQPPAYTPAPNSSSSELASSAPSIGRCSISVWGAISQDCLGPLVRLEGPFTPSRYCDVITGHLIPYALHGPFSDSCYLFQHDRRPVHKERVVQSLLEEHAVCQLEWPPCGADLNSIENVWGILKKRLTTRANGIRTADTLWQAIAREWENLRGRPDIVKSFYESMPTHINKVLENGGHFTFY
ncbi:hypothetical protein HPB51_016153 [Rhipicephalus microplus]|uniref:Tc1-like transposase DDE domain-containing protein n=1 Tax=Rhipicephalus microplus TaxID=6941 RepID=A0A9J6E243_RHIMP|nr:hypothetical protein HPB51_016153 [Rhipicephalus microplus]